jgi:hypothetical protein
MKSTLTWNIYQFIASATHCQKSPTPGLKDKLVRVFQSVKAYLNVGSEPYVWKTTSAVGDSQWSAYDPITHTAIEGVSETEVRVWLEERHYQYHCAAH